MIQEATPTPGLVAATGRAVPLESIALAGEVTAGHAVLRVAQIYRNSETEPIEALYTFPLPADGAVVGFRYRCGETLLEGEIREREQALREYTEAVHRGHGAALVERERDDVFSASVGNVLPGERVEIEVEVLLPLDFVDGLLRLKIPTLVAPRYIPGQPRGPRSAFGWADPTAEVPDADRITPPVGDPEYAATLDLRIALGFAAGVESPSHALAVSRREDGTVQVAFAAGAVALDRDLVLRLAAPGRATVQGLVAHRTGSGEGTFALTVVPDLGGESAGPRKLDVVFLLDRSGSMGGDSIVEARQAIRACLRQLRRGDRFTVLAFDHTLESFRDTLVPFDEAALEAVDRWIAAIDANGGTELGPALEAAVRLVPTGTIVLLTDAQVGDEDRVLRRLARGAAPRIFSFGIGTNIASGLLDALARRTGGAVEEIHPGEPIAEKVVAQFARAVSLRVEKLAIRVEGVEIDDLAPAAPEALTDGEPLVLLGRYPEAGTGTLEMTGELHGEPWRLAVPLALPAAAGRIGLDRIWAARRIRDLEREIALLDHPRRRTALGKLVVALSLEHRVLCRSTAFVVVERRSGARRRPGSPKARVIPVHRPAGWEMTARRLSISDLPVPSKAPRLAAPLPRRSTHPIEELRDAVLESFVPLAHPLVPPDAESSVSTAAAGPDLRWGRDAAGAGDPVTLFASRSRDGLWDAPSGVGEGPAGRVRETIARLLAIEDRRGALSTALSGELVRTLNALLDALDVAEELPAAWRELALRLVVALAPGAATGERARQALEREGWEADTPASLEALRERHLELLAEDRV